MSKLKVQLLLNDAPGAKDEVGLNERKPSKTQYHLSEKLLKIFLGPKKDLTVKKLREISPIWDMIQAGVDLKSIKWVGH